ncbi:MAG: LuxR C-terminal-related transcriptional regulator [Actinomycetota bacterium]
MAATPDPRRRRLAAALDRLADGHGAVRVDGVSSDLAAEARSQLAEMAETLEVVTGRRLERERPLSALDGLLPRRIVRALLEGGDPAGAAADELLDRFDLDPAVVLVLDGHWLDDVSASALAIAAGRRREQGTGWVLTFGSADISPTVAALVEAADVDSAIDVGSLDDAELAEAVNSALEGEASDRVLAAVSARTRGIHELVLALADGLGRVDSADAVAETFVPPSVVELVGRRLELVDDVSRRVIESASVAPDPDAAVVARLAGVEEGELTDLHHGLAAEGLPTVPLVLDAVRGLLGSRRSTELLSGLVAEGIDPVVIAERIEELDVAPEGAADVLVAAADRGCDVDPATAASRYARAARLGADAASFAARHARAEALAGNATAAIELAESVVDRPDGADRSDALVVIGSVLAAGAQLRPAAGSYAATSGAGGPEWWSALAVPPRSLLSEFTPPDDVDAVSAIGRAAIAFARGSAGLVEGDTAGELAESAELIELAGVADLWPDTPHAVLASALVARGDLAGADALLARAIEADVGGTAFRVRHQLLQGWAALRAGRWDDAAGTLVDVADLQLGLRDRLVASVLDLALVVRRGELEALDSGLDAAIAMVARHPPDLTSSDLLGEVARLVAMRRGHAGVRPLVDQLLALAGDVEPWRSNVVVHAAMAASLAGDDAAVVELADVEIEADEHRTAFLALLVGAHEDRADAAAVTDLAGALRDRGAVFEAAHLVGLAAVRTDDEASGKRLLLRARELRSALPSSGATEAVGLGALSERELDVARQVVNGHTHKEIGAALFISAKTVEHHVAHIRTKLGVSTRAEMLSTLRAGFGLAD